jgi:hypothetical protein
MMNQWGSEHVEDGKDRIKAFIWKVSISMFYAA